MPQAAANRGVLAITALTAALLVLLATPLDPRGFVSGDQGLKLMAAQAVLAHPAQPLRLDVPVLAGQPLPYLDRMVVAHGDHATVLQSPLFPVLSAPFLALFGLRGVYVLPALAFMALAPLTFVLYRKVSPSPSVGAWAASAVVGNPLFFYAFEFWEHVPAAACLAGATVLALRPRTTRALLAAGVLCGLALLLRPEAVFYALTVGVLLGTSRRDDTSTGRAWTGYVTGVAVVLAAYALGTFLESGSLIGDHVSANLGVVGDDWWHVRGTRLWLWLVGTPLTAAGLAGLAAAWALWAAGREAAARVLGLVAALLVAVGPLVQHQPDVLWRAWPLGALVLVPRRASGSTSACAWLAGATSLLVWLTSTHDGGAQWGPRILLIAAPAFIVLAADAVRELALPGPARAARVLLVAAVVGLGLWSSRQAYVELRGWKRYYASLVAAVERQTTAGDVIVTNVWWLDQICAELRPSRTFLVTASPAETAGALHLLQRHGAHTALLVWSTEDGAAGPMRTADSCFTASQPILIPERQVVMARASCGAAPRP